MKSQRVYRKASPFMAFLAGTTFTAGVLFGLKYHPWFYALGLAGFLALTAEVILAWREPDAR